MSWTFEKSVQYLESFIHYEKNPPRRKNATTFNIKSFARLLTALGNPHQNLRVIHVAGTKGKGSTCAMTAAILQAAGYRTGLYTSPHLISYCERIQIDGRPISRKKFARQVARVKKIIVDCPPASDGEFRTTFEILTAAAFLEFADRKVDVAVVETGLGGKLDATNVVTPDVAVLTTISLDHVEILGNTVAKIARDKAGIIKKGCTVIVGPQPKAAMQEIRRRLLPGTINLVYGRDWGISDVNTGLKKTQWDLSCLVDDGAGQEILFSGDAVRPLQRRPPATARRANRRHNAGGEPSFARLRESPTNNTPCLLRGKPCIWNR